MKALIWIHLYEKMHPRKNGKWLTCYRREARVGFKISAKKMAAAVQCLNVNAAAGVSGVLHLPPLTAADMTFSQCLTCIIKNLPITLLRASGALN